MQSGGKHFLDYVVQSRTVGVFSFPMCGLGVQSHLQPFVDSVVLLGSQTKPFIGRFGNLFKKGHFM